VGKGFEILELIFLLFVRVTVWVTSKQMDPYKCNFFFRATLWNSIDFGQMHCAIHEQHKRKLLRGLNNGL